MEAFLIRVIDNCEKQVYHFEGCLLSKFCEDTALYNDIFDMMTDFMFLCRGAYYRDNNFLKNCDIHILTKNSNDNSYPVLYKKIIIKELMKYIEDANNLVSDIYNNKIFNKYFDKNVNCSYIILESMIYKLTSRHFMDHSRYDKICLIEYINEDDLQSFKNYHKDDISHVEYCGLYNSKNISLISFDKNIDIIKLKLSSNNSIEIFQRHKNDWILC